MHTMDVHRDADFVVEETALDRLQHIAVHHARSKGPDYVEFIRLADGVWFRSPTCGCDSFYYRVTARGVKSVRVS